MKKRLQFQKQLDSMGCGNACVKMICNFHGIKISYFAISKHLSVTSDGVSLLSIENALNNYGFKCDSFVLSFSDLKQIELPAVLHWNQNHFVVLYKIYKDKYYIADPAKGKLIYSETDFLKHWSSSESCNDGMGIALTAKLIMAKEIKDHAHEQYTWRFVFDYFAKYKKYFLQILIGLLLGCLMQLLLPFLTQSIIDIGIKYQDIGFIWLVLVGELVIIIGRTATDFIRRWLLLHISMRVNITLVSDFFIKLLKLPMSFFDSKLTGDLLQRIEDHSRVQNFLTGQLLNVIFTFLSFIIFGFVLYIYNITVFFIFIFASIVYGIWVSFFLARRKIIDYELFEQQSINQDRTYQFITSIQEIKLQGCERRRRWEWEDIQADLFLIQMKYLKLQQVQEAGAIFVNEVKNILITVFAATAVINGQITIGAMLAIQYIVGQLNSPIEQLMLFIYSMQDVKISLERINEIRKKNDEDTNCVKTNPDSLENSTINIKNLNFKYDLSSIKNTLESVSFDIPEGKVTAIVGASGSGKTTLIKLILGYYDVMSGEILVSGKKLNDYNLRWWRHQCGVVMQDGVIFSESIARNIAVDDGDIDESRLVKAAKIANIHEFITQLPLKYNTKIGRNGVGLSQGQKQRILIARAVYKKPKFIFLDEATNALDANNERVIIENLDEFYKGRTVVVVAHRLSTVKNADQVVVMDNGRVVECGKHDVLIEKKGLYYNLVRNQLDLGK